MSDDLRNLWQNQPHNPLRMTIEEIHMKAAQFQKKIALRNKREYAAAAIVVVAFTGYAIFLPGALIKAGSILTVVAALFVAYRLHQKGSSRPIPAAMALSSSVEFHRTELERQRDLLRSVWLWYLAPFVPGMVLFGLGMGSLSWACGLAAIFAGVWWLNARAARKLQAEIDALTVAGTQTLT